VKNEEEQKNHLLYCCFSLSLPFVYQLNSSKLKHWRKKNFSENKKSRDNIIKSCNVPPPSSPLFSFLLFYFIYFFIFISFQFVISIPAAALSIYPIHMAKKRTSSENQTREKMKTQKIFCSNFFYFIYFFARHFHFACLSPFVPFALKAIQFLLAVRS
jgi:hypothetical protein